MGNVTKKEKQFIETVWQLYREQGRHALPWRKTKDSYRILVSEIMLQQTQVDRVLPKYKSFIKRWPTVRTLAEASLGDVLREWQGLGYNRRAKLLHECAREVMGEYGGKFPRTYEELLKLPGIGPYTAGAVMAFAYNSAGPILETNIRTVYIHHFLENKKEVSEGDIIELVERTLPKEQVREWYWALMDYGSYLKKEVGNLNKRAKAYQKQSRFIGSPRQVRGAIIRELSQGARSDKALYQLPYDTEQIKLQLEKLLAEQMIARQRGKYQLPR